MEEYDDVPEYLTCEDCNLTGALVQKMMCPYAREILDTEHEVVLCPDCRSERIQNI